MQAARPRLQSLRFRAKVWAKRSGIAWPEQPRRNEEEEERAEMNKKKKAEKSSGEAMLSRFLKIVGEKNAIRGEDMTPFLREQRDLYHGKAAMVLKPANAEEVAEILKLADKTKTAIVPQGGNTGLVGGQVPFDKNAIIVSTMRMNKIREVDADANTMTVESGVILQNAQEAAVKAERLFPLSLGAEGSCTIGGNLSTNAGGTQVLAYGNARDLVLGLEVVLANGKILRGLRKLKKDNTGYDLRHLFMGAEGTLGIITAAVLKLFPSPRAISTAWIGVPSPEAALSLLNLALSRAGTSLTSFELMPRIALEFDLRHLPGARDPLSSPHPWYVLAEIFGDDETRTRELMESLLADGVEKNLVTDATFAESVEQRNQLWKLRTAMSDVQKPEGGSIKHDISVPVSSVPAFVKEATREGGTDDPRRAGRRVRSSRRRQSSLQCEPARRRGQGEVPRQVGSSERRGSYDRREIRRLDLRRTRHRRPEARFACEGQGPGCAFRHARD
jgi:FAD/FMN-containing dehydrogenase